MKHRPSLYGHGRARMPMSRLRGRRWIAIALATIALPVQSLPSHAEGVHASAKGRRQGPAPHRDPERANGRAEEAGRSGRLRCRAGLARRSCGRLARAIPELLHVVSDPAQAGDPLEREGPRVHRRRRSARVALVLTAGGKQVAFEQETVHGGMGIHYELRDVATGNLIAAFDPAPGYEANSGAAADSVAVPEVGRGARRAAVAGPVSP